MVVWPVDGVARIMVLGGGGEKEGGGFGVMDKSERSQVAVRCECSAMR